MNDPVRVGILTCGTIVTAGHLPALDALGRDAADVVAFASRTRATAERAAAQWGSGVVVDDWRDVLARDDVDAVDICSPNAQHAEMAIAAAEAGKHVLVEKPIAVSLAEADAMIDAAAAAGVVLMAAHNLRFAAPYAAAATAVATGMIGEVVGVRVAFGHAGPQAWAPSSTWFREVGLSGGGALLDLGIHVADLLRAVTGDEIEEVSAFLRRPSADAVEEAGQVAFSLRGGGVGSFHASWVARPGPDHQLVVHGTDGSLSIERGRAVVRPADGADKVVVEPPAAAPDLFGSFVAACRREATPAVTGEDGRAALAVIVAAYQAAAERRAVAVAHR
ncbi:MAG TPA: Gfo/Idh/MocA family oxidoreductase [Acidimicrobiales bacterium]|nr:Gfo/Idh/MocA family oxidoreductase [Acidimicrobiales bacterium]